jgi:hypothetical protein
MGGSDTYNPKWRDWGCSLITVGILICILPVFTLKGGISYFLTFLLSWGALSTYWKKGADCKWWNWFFHGLGVGLACLPLILIGVSTINIMLRSLVIATFMTIVSEASDNVWVEEFSRGALIVLSMPILFL